MSLCGTMSGGTLSTLLGEWEKKILFSTYKWSCVSRKKMVNPLGDGTYSKTDTLWRNRVSVLRGKNSSLCYSRSSYLLKSRLKKKKAMVVVNFVWQSVDCVSEKESKFFTFLVVNRRSLLSKKTSEDRYESRNAMNSRSPDVAINRVHGCREALGLNSLSSTSRNHDNHKSAAMSCSLSKFDRKKAKFTSPSGLYSILGN